MVGEDAKAMEGGVDIDARIGELAAGAKYTWSEVKKHNTYADAWVVHKDKVYDVSKWKEHPGGAAIFTHCGEDITDIFSAMHPPGTEAIMQKFHIGTVECEKGQRQRDFEKAHRDLRSKLIVAGMFKASKLYYVRNSVSTLLLLATAFALVSADSVAMHISSAVLVSLFWMQCGWTAHDFAHHQVFDKRMFNDVASIFWSNFMTGFSVQWWKSKHNAHHSSVNTHPSAARSFDGDPDIDTMPLLAWPVKKAQSNSAHTETTVRMIRWQAYTFLPILLLARLSWLRDSLTTAFNLGYPSANGEFDGSVKGAQYPLLERIGMIVHWTCVVTLSSGFGRFSVAYSLMYFALCTFLGGFFLALAFIVGHSGRALYTSDARPDFWTMQVGATRNIVGSAGLPKWLLGWFMGGLQYQIEHHLYPTMPRHNLGKCREIVKPFCEEWSVLYHETDFLRGYLEVLAHLQTVSDEFVHMLAQFPAM